MKRKLFCEISPFTYKVSLKKQIVIRSIKDCFTKVNFATTKINNELDELIIKHNSFIRRKLNNVDLNLQENKATNLSIASPKINKIIIKPGETFSFWKLVGNCTKKKGYKEGLTITKGNVSKGTGGGMCQFTNLIHWLVLHSPLSIIEHHHHTGVDLFPDSGRKVPFGVGTSICYNALDYRFINNTNITFQLIVYVDDEYLCGELRADKKINELYNIIEEESYFYKKNDKYYRHNKIYREVTNKITGEKIEKELLQENNSLVMYDSKFIDEKQIVENISK